MIRLTPSRVRELREKLLSLATARDSEYPLTEQDEADIVLMAEDHLELMEKPECLR